MQTHTKIKKGLMAQLKGGEKTMEKFLDRLLHESVYDRRVRPFYRSGKSDYCIFYSIINFKPVLLVDFVKST